MIVKPYRFLWVVLLVSLIPFLLVSAVTLAMLVMGQATTDELALPFVGISGMSIATLLILGIPVLLMGVWEGATIKRLVTEDYWACWAQYPTEDAWHNFAEREYQREMKANAFSWAAVIMLVILFMFISVATSFIIEDSTDRQLIVVPLGVFFVIITTLVLGGPLAGRRRSAANYRRRLRAPIPNVYVGKSGLYDDDEGYKTFRGLNERLINVYYKDGSPAKVVYEIRYWRRYHSGTAQTTVRIPRDRETEAKKIAQRYFEEGVLKR